MDFRKLIAQERQRLKEKNEINLKVSADPAEEQTCSETFTPSFPNVRLGKQVYQAKRWCVEAHTIKPELLHNSLFYIPNFLTKAEEDVIASSIYCKAAKWVQLKSRRLQCYSLHRNLIFPSYLKELIEAVKTRVDLSGFETEPFAPNYALVNEYLPGEGIIPHTDGMKYKSYVASISLLSPVVMKFIERQSSETVGVEKPQVLCRLLLERGSLLLFREPLYSHALHGIDAVLEEDIGSVDNPTNLSTEKDRLSRQKRVSITFREERIHE